MSIKLRLMNVLVVCAMLLIALCGPSLSSVTAAPRFAGPVALSTTYTQNFNGLTPAGSWADNTTLDGWYAITGLTPGTIASYALNNGSNSTANLVSLGSTGAPDRALGSICSNGFCGAAGTGYVYYGVRMVNSSASNVAALTVTYTGEQWRTNNNINAQKLEFAYQVGATVTDLKAGTWTAVTNLDFTGPQTTGTVQLDGNLFTNRTPISYTFPVTVPVGEEIMLRWKDLNDSGNDHTLGIDDLSVTARFINLDGTVSSPEWDNGVLGTVSSTQFGVTWDDDFWYFSVKGGFANTDYFMIGIDSDPTNHTTNTGGTAARCGATFPSENKPDFILAQRQNTYTRESWGWNGSAWDQPTWNPAETDDYNFSGAGGDYEVMLRKSSVFATNASTSPVGFYLWLSNDICQPFNAWPPENHNGWTGSDQFLYAHTYFENTNGAQVASTYHTRVGWDSKILSSNSTAYNFFGADDHAANPWLRMTTTAGGAGGAGCTVTAQLVGNRAFTSPSFTGINRYIDFTFNTCANVNVDVQMRYEQNEVVSTTESAAQFYHCSLATCTTTDWALVTGVTYTRDTANNNILLSGVAQDQFSKWMSAGPAGPTAIAFDNLSARSGAASSPLWIGFGLLLVCGLLVVKIRK